MILPDASLTLSTVGSLISNPETCSRPEAGLGKMRSAPAPVIAGSRPLTAESETSSGLGIVGNEIALLYLATAMPPSGMPADAVPASNILSSACTVIARSSPSAPDQPVVTQPPVPN